MPTQTAAEIATTAWETHQKECKQRNQERHEEEQRAQRQREEIVTKRTLSQIIPRSPLAEWFPDTEWKVVDPNPTIYTNWQEIEEAAKNGLLAVVSPQETGFYILVVSPKSESQPSLYYAWGDSQELSMFKASRIGPAQPYGWSIQKISNLRDIGREMQRRKPITPIGFRQRQSEKRR